MGCLHSHTGDLAIEAFTCMIIFKNVFSFALTLKAFDWLVTTNTKATPLFNILASIQVGVCVLSIPMCKLSVFYEDNPCWQKPGC